MLDSKKISNKILSYFKGGKNYTQENGININLLSDVDGGNSETALMVELIVKTIVESIIVDAEVNTLINDVSIVTFGSPSTQTGTNGLGTGRGRIR